jgi:hypothetical protein
VTPCAPLGGREQLGRRESFDQALDVGMPLALMVTSLSTQDMGAEEVMKTHTFGPLIAGIFATAGVFATVCLAAPAAAGQEPAQPPPSLGTLDTPHALRMEDRHLRDDLARALQDQGSVGSAAKEIEHILLPHLEARENLVFRPLGLLRALAQGDPGVDRARAIAAVEQIERELPKFEQEHRAIYDANKRLIDAANREHKPQYLDLSDRIWVHMRLEEEVLYPTVSLVGRYLKLQEHAKPRATSRATR